MTVKTSCVSMADVDRLSISFAYLGFLVDIGQKQVSLCSTSVLLINALKTCV